MTQLFRPAFLVQYHADGRYLISTIYTSFLSVFCPQEPPRFMASCASSPLFWRAPSRTVVSRLSFPGSKNHVEHSDSKNRTLGSHKHKTSEKIVTSSEAILSLSTYLILIAFWTLTTMVLLIHLLIFVHSISTCLGSFQLHLSVISILEYLRSRMSLNGERAAGVLGLQRSARDIQKSCRHNWLR